MKGGPMNGEVRDNEKLGRYELEVEGALAVAEYRLRDGRITFTHTKVPAEIEGRGVGSEIGRAHV